MTIGDSVRILTESCKRIDECMQAVGASSLRISRRLHRIRARVERIQVDRMRAHARRKGRRK